ncbi:MULTISPECIES: peroxiredoxin [unclassified Nocardia]|uniref:peroxiredoxin family protein n=2 Tax=Nocardia TaxID=1817 RepID=UPI00278C594B|nr:MULTISPECIES: MauE/DoxX family redox-associated membrane protein [unclassified Nocardia]
MVVDYGVWVSRLLLATVFGLSAWGKFADLAGTRKAVHEFGIGLRWVSLAAWALPVVEAVIAVAALPPRSAVGAAVAAGGLLVVFTVAVVRLLRAGQHPACSCFGAASSVPIGRATVVRNGVLIALAVLVAVGALAVPEVPGSLPADHAVGMAVVAVLLALFLLIQGELRVVRRRLDEQALSTLGAEGLPVGAVAPEFELLTPEGDRSGLSDLLRAGRHLLLVFVHPHCEMCAALARELPRWHRRTAAELSIVVVGNGDPAEHEKWAEVQGVGDIPVLVQQGNEAALRYRVRGTPSAVLIGADGRIAAPVARGATAIRELVVQSGRYRKSSVAQSISP